MEYPEKTIGWARDNRCGDEVIRMAGRPHVATVVFAATVTDHKDNPFPMSQEIFSVKAVFYSAKKECLGSSFVSISLILQKKIGYSQNLFCNMEY